MYLLTRPLPASSDSEDSHSRSTELSLLTMAGAENGIRQRNVNTCTTVSRVVTPTAEGKKRDEELDKHTEYALPVHTCTFPRSNPLLGMSLVDHGVLWPS